MHMEFHLRRFSAKLADKVPRRLVGALAPQPVMSRDAYSLEFPPHCATNNARLNAANLAQRLPFDEGYQCAADPVLVDR
jgi:hypothetical protein